MPTDTFNQLLNDEQFDYSYVLKQIVFVNSASHAYTELALDQHLAMFGDNNLGKTASLSATKLLLYPETNFNKCESKFNFVSKSGRKFKRDESYEYYFPTANSFLIMEGKNPSGEFCMILYRAGNYEYNRVLLPVPFDDIRHLFWDSENNYFTPNLSVQTILSAVKTYKGLHVSNKAILSKILFGNFASADAKYCLVPLKDQRESSIEAFINIFELAFNSGKGEESTLPQAIATIIEMRRGRDEERMDADFSALQDDYEKLTNEGMMLKKYENNKIVYETLKGQFDAMLASVNDYSLSFKVLKTYLNRSQEQQANKLGYITEQLNSINAKKNPLASEVKNLETQLIELNTQHKSLLTSINTYEQKQIAVETILSEFNKPADVVMYELRVRLEELSEMLKSIDNIDQATTAITTKTHEISTLTARLARLESAKDNLSLLATSQLPEHSASVLISLNNEFSELICDLSDSDIQTINAFAELFNSEKGVLTFKESTLANTNFVFYDKETEAKKNVEQIINNQAHIQKLRKDIGSLNSIIADANNSVADHSKKKLKTEHDQISLNIDDIGGLAVIKRQISESKATLNKVIKEHGLATDKHAGKQEELNGYYAAYTDYSKQKEDIESFIRRFDTTDKIIERSNSHFQATYIPDDDEQYLATLDGILVLELEDFEKLQNKAIALAAEKSEYKTKLQRFMEDIPLADLDPHKEITGLHEYSEIIALYKNTFDRINVKKEDYKHKVYEHHSYLASMLEEIKNANRLLQSEITAMNQELSHHKVSNFDAVRLRLTTQADYRNLLDNCSKYDLSQDTLLEPEFYTSLISYIKENSHSKKRTLKMVNLIKSISYEYVEDTGHIETKPQSGGTTSTVTSFIISILLSNIFAQDSTLMMPVIVDEIADMDKKNIKTIVNQIAQSGFSVFCATPHRLSTVCKHVGNHINIDYCKFNKDLMHPDCVLHILPQHIDTFGKRDSAEERVV